MSLVIGGMFYVEAAVNLVQCGVLVQRRGVDKLVILPVHRKPVRLQVLIGTVAEVAPLRAGRHLVDGKVGLRRGLIVRGNIFLHRQPGSGGLLFQLCLDLLFVVLQALVEIGKLRRLRQMVLALIEKRAALLYIVQNRVEISGLFRRQGFPGSQGTPGILLHSGQIAMQLHIRDKLMQQHIPLGLVRLPCLRPLMVQHMVFPAFILCVVFVIAPDMLDQGTVPVTKVLPSLVAVRLALHGKINAELGLVVPMARIARLLPFMASGAVQLLKNGLGFMQRHLLAVFQMGAFTPKDRDNRLRCRILRDLPLGVGNGNLTFDLAFHKGIHLALLQLVALFTQAVDKPDHLVSIAHGLGIRHNQLPFLAAQTRGVFLRQLHQGGGPVSRGRLRHERLSIQKAVDPVPCLWLGNGVGLFGCFQKTVQPVAGQGFHCPSW